MKIKLIRSTIGQNARVRETVKSLGFKRLQQVREVKDHPSVLGMVKKVQHMVQIIERSK
jgi:large subunit ribosomal protein L30